MKQEFFGMRRANRDWFVLDIAGQSRVLVFRNLADAWRTRALNSELMLFWPAPIDERALAEFATANQGRPANFWLIDEDEPSADLQRGHPLGYMQIATLERLRNIQLKRGTTGGEAPRNRAWAS